MSYSPILFLPPIYDPFFIERNGNPEINEIWLKWMNAIYDSLSPFLVKSYNSDNRTLNFLQLPTMTTAQRDSVSTPPNGVVIYNSTIPAVQARVGGAWVNL